MDGKTLNENENKLLNLVNQSTITVDNILKKLEIENKTNFPDDITLLLMSSQNDKTPSLYS
jgi:hypothetical protein